MMLLGTAACDKRPGRLLLEIPALKEILPGCRSHFAEGEAVAGSLFTYIESGIGPGIKAVE